MKSLAYFVVALLLVGSIAAIGIGKEASNVTKTNESPITVLHHGNQNTHNLAVESKDISHTLGRIFLPAANSPVANTEDDEIHPTVSVGAGKYFSSYVNKISIIEQYIYMAISEDGSTWTPAGYWDLDELGDYPASDYWGGNRFCGTFMITESLQYLMDLEDIDDTGTWSLISWDWSDDGWSDLHEFDIACHNSQNTWEYGVMSSVGTTDYGDWDVVDGPHMFFRDPEDEGTGYISWDLIPGCAHSAASIDKAMDFTYNAYDWYNDGTGYWDLLVWKRDFSDMLEGDSDIITVESTINVEYPTIGASNDNIVIVGQSDDAGNEDLVCFYSSNGGDTWDQSTVVNTNDDEIAPDISFIGSQAACVFVKNGDLYLVQSDDGGATWSSPLKVNDETGTVIQEYRTADTCPGAVIWGDERGDNPDIYFETLGDSPAKPSKPDGPSGGSTRTSYTYETVSNDPNGDDISYGWDWDGDDVVDEWTGLNPSGTPVSTSHTWTGTYEGNIKVKAKDSDDHESPWSDPLSVSMPKTKQVTYPLLQKFLEIFPNASLILRYLLKL